MDIDEAKGFEQLVDGIVDAAPAVLAFDPDDATTQSLINDVGIGMVRPHVIAARYGLTAKQFLAFIKIPEVTRRIKLRKAVWESDDNQPERIRRMYGQLTLEAAPSLDKLLHDPTTPAAVKLKGLELSGRFGGADARGGGANNSEAATGPMFSVQFVFAGSGTTQAVTMVSGPPTIDAPAIDASAIDASALEDRPA